MVKEKKNFKSILYPITKLGKIRFLIEIILLLIIVFLFKPLVGYHSNYNYKELKDTMSYHHYTNDIQNKIILQDLTETPFIADLYSKTFFQGIAGFYNMHSDRIVLLDNFNKSSTLFHEYLHYKYFNSNFSKEDKIKLFNLVTSSLGDKQLLMSLLDYEEMELDRSLTEYISYKYEVYYASCIEEKDSITSFLIEKNVLPPTIYCKNKRNN